jgi:hypothetical protein
MPRKAIGKHKGRTSVDMRFAQTVDEYVRPPGQKGQPIDVRWDPKTGKMELVFQEVVDA